jgi:hypothetical protein
MIYHYDFRRFSQEFHSMPYVFSVSMLKNGLPVSLDTGRRLCYNTIYMQNREFSKKTGR